MPSPPGQGLGYWDKREQGKPGRHLIERVSYRSETIECSCGEIITAAPDEFIHDAHEPLTLAWQAHRRAVGTFSPRGVR